MDMIWWITAVVGAIVLNLIASELFTWGPRLSEHLMQRAVDRLVPAMQDRMREEWAAHLNAIPPGLWRIVTAAGFCLSTRKINIALGVREPVREVIKRLGLRVFPPADVVRRKAEALLREMDAKDQLRQAVRRQLMAEMEELNAVRRKLQERSKPPPSRI